MKIKKLPGCSSSSIVYALAAAALATLLLPSFGLAASATWQTTTGSATFATSGNWISGAVPNAISDVADLSQVSLTGNVTATLGVSTTIGGLLLGTTSGAYSYTISGTGANTLVFNNGSSDGYINVVSTSRGDAISAPVTIGGDKNLDITNNSGYNLTISGTIGESAASSAVNILKGGLVLSATANTFTGGVNIQGGTLLLSNAATGAFTVGAAGTGAITIGATSGSAIDAALLFGYQGSTNTVTVANNITVSATNAGKATIGQAGTAQNQQLSFSNSVTLNKDTYLSSGDGYVTFAGGLTGTGGIIVVSTGGEYASNGQIYGNAVGQVKLTTANSYGGNTNILSGDLLLAPSFTGTLDQMLGTATSSIAMGDTSGNLSARLLLTTSSTNKTLARSIVTQAGGAGYDYIYSSGANTTLSGGIVLNKSIVLGAGSGITLTVGGVISPGANAIGGVSLIKSGDRATNIITLNAANTYNGGTIVGNGVVDGTATAVNYLGTGNAEIEGGVLRLRTQSSLAAGKTVLVDSAGELQLYYTHPTGTLQTYLQSIIDSRSSGGISTNENGSTTVLNLATLGNGYMYLAGATYTGTSLGANQDGNYRLGYGGDTLTVSSANVLTGAAAQLIVGGSSGNLNPNAASSAIQHQIMTNGTVKLSASNSYSGGTVINKDSTLSGQALASGNPFGTVSDSTAMILHAGATLQLLNSAAATTTTKIGAATYDGAAYVIVNGTTGGVNTMQATSLTRVNNGVLAVTSGAGTGSTLGTSAILTTAGTAPSTIATNGGANTMIAPYYYDNAAANTGYLTYDAVKGFIDATIGQSVAAAGAISLTGTDSYVKTTGTATIASSGTISALVLGGSLTTSGSSTLTISSGGLLLSSTTDMNVGGNANAINLNFGSAEGVINALNTGHIYTIYNQISGSGGLTKTGAGTLILQSSNNFTGQVTIDQGTLQMNNSANGDAPLGASTNAILINGGALTYGYSCAVGAGHALTIGANGATLNMLQTATSGTYAGVISGSGVYLNVNNASSNLYSTTNTLFLSNTANSFTSAINLTNHIALQFDDARELGSGTNTISLSGGNAALLYVGGTDTTVGRGMAFLDLGGAVDVKNNVTLTLSGPISGSGMFNKNGLGTLALTGSSSNVGNLSINAGVLNISNSNALGAASSVVTGSSGVSGGAAFVQSGAALEMQGGIAVADKTLYLNGSGISGNGALRNVSGINSLGGTVVLQSDTTIGADAGSVTLSGPIIGASALTKVGSGTLTFSGANTYTGATTVGNGTLTVNGSLAAGSAVTVNSGATLNGNGTINGTLGVSGVLAGTLTVANDATINGGATAAAAAFNGNVADNGNISSGFTVASGKTLSGSGTASGVVTANGNITGGLTFNNDVTINGGATAVAVAFNGNVTNGGSITSDVHILSTKTLSGSGSVAGAVIVSGALSGSVAVGGDLTIDTAGSMSGAHTLGGNVTLNNSTVANVSSGITLASGKTLNGTGGTIGAVDATALGAVVAPGGASVGNLTVGSFSTATGAHLGLRINATTAGNYDTLTAATSVSLSGGDLALSVGSFTPGTDILFLIINNQGGPGGTAGTTGAFNSINFTGAGIASQTGNGAEGSQLTLNGTIYTLTYQADFGSLSSIGGNDVALYAVVPEPETWAMLAGGLGLLIFSQRLRKRSA